MSSLTFNQDYIRRLADGDKDVQQHFADYFGSLLRIKLRHKLRSSDLIEDIRQETLYRVLKSLHSQEGIRNPESLGSFVNSVCNNVTLEFFRDKYQNPQAPEEMPDVIDENADPSDAVEASERQAHLARVLQNLPSQQQELLRKVYFEERSKRQICRDLNVSPDYLRVLIFRAKEKLREALTQVVQNAAN